MAALECNGGQDGYSPKENGSVSEEKSLSIDYSEDLWLANSEDSSGHCTQEPGKVLGQESPGVFSCQPEVSRSYTSSPLHGPVDSHAVAVVSSEFPEPQAVNAGGQMWSEATSGDIGSGSVTIQSAGCFVNGHIEQNGVEFNNSGEGKDFAQLLPAGGFVDGGAGGGTETQDKTFTSLMPVTALSVGEEMQPGYDAILGSQHGHVVYYSLDHQVNVGPSVSETMQENASVSYDHSVQMAAVNGEGAGGREKGSDAVYVSVDGLNTNSQAAAVARNFAVLSPAVIGMAEVHSQDQSYSAHIPCSSYQHISTLPYVQNGAYTTFASYHPADTPSIVSNGVNQQQQVLQQGDYSSDQASFSSDGAPLTTLTASLQPNAVDYQDEDDDDDEEEEEDDDDDDDQDEDMNIDDNSAEFSELTCQMCSEQFPDQASLDDHVNNHPPLKTFVCETCGKGFATRRYLKYHRKNHCKRAGSYEGRNELDENDPNGELKRFSCNVCNRPFRVLKCMKVHKKKKHGILKEHTCQNCAVTFDSSQELIDHPCGLKSVSSTPHIIHHTPPPLAMPSQKKKRKLKHAKPSCDICGKTFSDRISVDIHRVKHIEEELCPCDMCDEDGDPNASHLAVHFRIRFFTDDNQHILEDQKAAVASHDHSQRSDGNGSMSATPVHNADPATPHSAPATPLYFPTTLTNSQGIPLSASAINSSDYSTETGMQLLGSPARNGELSDQSGFAQKYTDFIVGHPEGSITVPNYVANERNSESPAFITEQKEKVHEEEENEYCADFEEGEVIHDASGSILAVTPSRKQFSKSKLHVCGICNKTFGDAAKLEVHHKSSHEEDRPYQCDVCKKSFFTKWKLQRHMLSHLEQKPHCCPMCSKSFVERGKLEAHYRTHLGTKPFKCDQCPKAFTVKSQLSIHQRRIHSTDQPFGCLVCGKAFLWKSGLDKHMKKHTREKPNICGVCGIKYSNKANLIVHMSKAHNQAYIVKQSP